MDNKKAIKKIALSSVLIAIGVGFGYLLSGIPNIELITLTIFIAGYSLGAIYGSSCGAMIWIIYGAFNPFGMAPLPIFAAQIIAGAFIGIFGAIAYRIIKNIKERYLRILIFAFSGAFLTLFYQILINSASFISFGSKDTLIAYIIGGLSFALLHIVSNTLIFSILIPPLERLLSTLNDSQNYSNRKD
ncbi:MAG: ECF transporter S component [Candidatus Zixiibacteriota bacterium]